MYQKRVANRRRKLGTGLKNNQPKNKKRFLRSKSREIPPSGPNPVNLNHLFLALGLYVGICFCSILLRNLHFPDLLNHVFVLCSFAMATCLCLEKAFGSRLRKEDLFSATEGYIAQLEIEIESAPQPTVPEQSTEKVSPVLSQKIFIVHGHNGELKEATARLVSQLDLEPVILHEQARQGRPIIENFSIHAKESGFAIILLTADDVGSLGTVEQHAALQPRARQNVVFEMGFFLGLLGQGRVCAIYDVGVEMPSDLGGILHVRHDAPSGKWRWDVAKEIQAAGYDVDLNKL